MTDLTKPGMNPVSGKPFDSADVARLLQLGEQTLGEWEDDNRRPATGSQVLDPDAVAFRRAYDALRPVLLLAPDLLALRDAVGACIEMGPIIGQHHYEALAAAYDKVC